MSGDAVRSMEIGVCRSANGSILYHTVNYGNEWCCITVLNFHNAPVMTNTKCVMEIHYRNEQYGKEYYHNHSCTQISIHLTIIAYT